MIINLTLTSLCIMKIEHLLLTVTENTQILQLSALFTFSKYLIKIIVGLTEDFASVFVGFPMFGNPESVHCSSIRALLSFLVPSAAQSTLGFPCVWYEQCLYRR